MKSLRLIVSGRVQKVGYRSLIDEIAFALSVNGQVKNLDDKTVEIIAEHEDGEILEKFIEKIKINEYPIRVTEVIREEIEPKNYKQFEVIEGPLELENRESLEAGAVYMRKLASNMESMNDKLDVFTTSVSTRFDTVDTKYGKISDRLDKINTSLEKLVAVLEVFKPK